MFVSYFHSKRTHFPAKGHGQISHNLRNIIVVCSRYFSRLSRPRRSLVVPIPARLQQVEPVPLAARPRLYRRPLGDQGPDQEAIVQSVQVASLRGGQPEALAEVNFYVDCHSTYTVG